MRDDQDGRVLSYVEREILQGGEKIRWRGRPAQKSGASASLPQFFFGIFFFGFSIFWTTMALNGGLLFAAFGLPFMGVGFWMVTSPLRGYWRAGRTYYAITNRRVLIIEAARHFKINSIFPNQITNYERIDTGDGQGTIKLRRSISTSRNGTSMTTKFTDALWGISDVKGAAKALAGLTAQPA